MWSTAMQGTGSGRGAGRCSMWRIRPREPQLRARAVRHHRRADEEVRPQDGAAGVRRRSSRPSAGGKVGITGYCFGGAVSGGRRRRKDGLSARRRRSWRGRAEIDRAGAAHPHRDDLDSEDIAHWLQVIEALRGAPTPRPQITAIRPGTASATTSGRPISTKPPAPRLQPARSTSSASILASLQAHRDYLEGEWRAPQATPLSARRAMLAATLIDASVRLFAAQGGAVSWNSGPTRRDARAGVRERSWRCVRGGWGGSRRPCRDRSTRWNAVGRGLHGQPLQ